MCIEPSSTSTVRSTPGSRPSPNATAAPCRSWYATPSRWCTDRRRPENALPRCEASPDYGAIARTWATPTRTCDACAAILAGRGAPGADRRRPGFGRHHRDPAGALRRAQDRSRPGGVGRPDGLHPHLVGRDLRRGAPRGGGGDAGLLRSTRRARARWQDWETGRRLPRTVYQVSWCRDRRCIDRRGGSHQRTPAVDAEPEALPHGGFAVLRGNHERETPMTRRNPRGAIARILPRLWGARHTPAFWERSLHVRVVRGSSSIAEQVASYHQVPVQIRPPALFLQVFKETPVLIVALCQLAAGPVPAPSRAAVTVVEYLLPRPRAFPHDPAVGRDGIVWYTDQANSYIGRLDPATGQVTDYAAPTQASGPHGIIVAPDGGVWYTANFKARLGRLDPANGSIKEYALPATARDPHTPLYYNGAIWFTAQGANLYGSLDPRTGEAKLFPVPTPGARPYGLVAGPSGTIWMALFGTNKIGRITARDGSLREYPLPDPAARPRRLAVDAHGIVWYSDYARGQLGRLDPATGQVREFPCPGGGDSQPYGLAVGTDGRIWYDESGKNEIVAFDPASERTETVAIPTAGSVVRNMAVDSTRARLWLALSGTQRLGRIDLAPSR